LTLCGQLILRKISKFDAMRCQILRLKYKKNQFMLGLRPTPRWGSLQRSPRPPDALKGPTSKRERGRERDGKGRGEVSPLLPNILA